MERLSGMYNAGYTKAILDLQDTMRYVDYDLKCHRKKWNYQLIQDVVSLFLDNRESIRENRPGFIRWNTSKCALEWFDKNE